MKNKRANIGGWIVFGVILFVVIVGAGVTVKYLGDQELSIDKKSTTGSISDFCSNNPDLDLKVRAKDILATTTTYENVTFYLVDKNVDGSVDNIVEKTMDQTDGDYDTFTGALECDKPGGYEIYVKTTQDNKNADGIVVIEQKDLSENSVEVDIDVSKHSLLKVKAYDNKDRAKLTNDSVGVSTDYVTLGDTATFNGTGLEIGADGYVDVTFTLAPDSSNEAGGDEAIICVDYSDSSNTDDWEGSSLELTFEGISLSETSLNSNDASALSDYEICYGLPHPVGKSASGNYDSVSTLRMYIESQSGVNPDDDLVLRYVELGDYLDDDDNTVILDGVVARTDSSRTFLGSASTSTITLDIDNS